MFESMRHNDKPRSGIALGGIGTGSIELRKDGLFHNWNIFNNQPFGYGPRHEMDEDSMLFFLVRYQVKGMEPRLKILQIPEGYHIGTIPNHVNMFPWLSGVAETTYESRYPFVWMTFSDPDMPVDIEMEAWSPFIPHDVKNSSLPAAVFTLSATSKINKPVDVMIVATLRNAVGYDDPNRYFVSRLEAKGNRKTTEMTCGGMDKKSPSYGTMSLSSLSKSTTHHLGWEHRHPYYERLIRELKFSNIDDTANRNNRDPKTKKTKAGPRCFSSLGVSKQLPRKGHSLDNTFVLTWDFPNHHGKDAKNVTAGDGSLGAFEGHYHNNFFKSSLDVADYIALNLDSLYDDTLAFNEALYDSTLPEWMLDQINSNLNTFAASAWLNKKGQFGVCEGLTPRQAWGPKGTIDVSIYGLCSTSALFPELAKNMMLAHADLQKKSGEVSHGFKGGFGYFDGVDVVHSRLDLPAQYVILALRCFFWTNDKAFLKKIWPSCKATLEYALRERDLNGDGMPDMEGCMCTFDNFAMYGPASFIGTQWLAALSQAVEAAKVLGDKQAAERYGEVFERADKVFESELWNGNYYRLYNNTKTKKDQIDEGCLTDQMIGAWCNHLVGLPPVHQDSRRRKAMRSILRRNRKHIGISNCSWPEDKFLHPVPDDCWDDQANACWAGSELAFTSFLFYEGMVKDALHTVHTVDERYRRCGLYYDHQEFGGHYYRSMSAWGILNGVLGLTINQNCYGFAPALHESEQKILFGHADGMAHFITQRTKTGDTVSLEILSGKFIAREISLKLPGNSTQAVASIRAAGKAVGKSAYATAEQGGKLVIRFRRPLSVPAGKKLEIKITA